MQAFLISTGVVALGEMGDKTQLLAFVLAARFKRPLPIILGILAATLVNHGLAGELGHLIASRLGPDTLRWAVGLGFLAMAAWILVPDRADDDAGAAEPRWGVLGTTLVSFFFAEMGDKTQIATMGLAARFHDLVPVVAGTTLGMMIADVPAVFLGDKFAGRLALPWLRAGAAVVFALLGLASLFGPAFSF
ncbi:MAG: TMEM165/GDT1 family protein [Burkholderiales bacterium]|nr:TMEM165/GDT1 family protein [Burkholderiales bacterium]